MITDDRGVATVWSAWVIAALAALMGLVAVFGTVTAVRHRVIGAADLSALAAATSSASGERYACEQALWVAERMGAWLDTCRLTGWVAHVEVSASVAGIGEATAQARAGPVADNPHVSR